MAAAQLAFYDVKAKKKFKTNKYKVVNRSGRRFAVANSPHSDIQSWRILGKGGGGIN